MVDDTELSAPQWMVPVKQIKLVLQVAQRLSVDTEQLMAQCNIEPAWLDNLEHQVPASVLYNLYHQLASEANVPDIGLLVGRSAYLNLVDILLYLSSICTSLRQWLKMMPSVLEVYGDLGKATIIKDSDSLRSQWCPLVDVDVSDRFIIDMALSTAQSILASICVFPVTITRATFTYPKPNDFSLLTQCFGSQLLFDQPASAIYFQVECLDYPLIQATEQSSDANPWQSYIQRAAGDEFLDELRHSIARLLPTGEMSVDNVATELLISRRTLQRRLTQRDTNFVSVVADLRYQMALRFLNDNKLAITSIAFLLGYSDSSSFSTAFKTWHGCAPSKLIY